MVDLDKLSDEDYFAAFKALFAHPSWTIYLATLEREMSALNNVDSMKTVEDLFYRKGQLRVIQNLLTLETTLLNAEESQGAPEAIH